MSYPCTQCGCCCRKINTAVENIKIIHPQYQFPHTWDETGRCEMLTDDNMCKVYDNRPEICNIDFMIGFFEMDFTDTYKECIKICNRLMDEFEVDPSKRITV